LPPDGSARRFSGESPAGADSSVPPDSDVVAERETTRGQCPGAHHSNAAVRIWSGESRDSVIARMLRFRGRASRTCAPLRFLIRSSGAHTGEAARQVSRPGEPRRWIRCTELLPAARDVPVPFPRMTTPAVLGRTMAGVVFGPSPDERAAAPRWCRDRPEPSSISCPARSWPKHNSARRARGYGGGHCAGSARHGAPAGPRWLQEGEAGAGVPACPAGPAVNAIVRSGAGTAADTDFARLYWTPRASRTCVPRLMLGKSQAGHIKKGVAWRPPLWSRRPDRPLRARYRHPACAPSSLGAASSDVTTPADREAGGRCASHPRRACGPARAGSAPVVHGELEPHQSRARLYSAET
jgi:hypothetical protein